MPMPPVKIRNDLPVSVTCEGIYYKETKDLSLKQLILFIDRDFFALRNQYPESNFTISMVQKSDHKQIRVGATAKNATKAKQLQLKIEQILWSYNQQVLNAKNGSLVPGKSRFSFRVDVQIHGSKEVFQVILGGRYD